jgi:hypothetical protein
MGTTLNRKRLFRTVDQQRARHAEVLRQALIQCNVAEPDSAWLADRLVEAGVRVKLSDPHPPYPPGPYTSEQWQP